MGAKNTDIVSESKKLQQEVRKVVDEYLQAFFYEKHELAAAISPQYGQLWYEILTLSQAGGKRLRPYMAVLANRCYGGMPNDIVPVAAAWELLHLSLLIHDDIIDSDLVRYGVDNIAGRYRMVYGTANIDTARRDHYADSAAILAGDLLLSSANELVVESSLDSQAKIVALRYLQAATFAVAGGELLDTEASIYPISEAKPLTIIQYKTAGYSFVGPLCCGAELAGANQQELTKIETLGNALGFSFQLRDDLLGVFGDSSITGKSTSSDLLEGKRTYLLQQTYALVSKTERMQLDTLIGKVNMTQAEATIVRTIMQNCGAVAVIEKRIEEYISQSAKIIDDLAIAEPMHVQLRQLADIVAKRSK